MCIRDRYITHDLAVARYMCNRIAVMFNGKIVEIAETEKLLSNPVHPYTKRLISSIPVPDPKYNRVEYDLNYDELDEIIKNNPDKKMVDIGGKHYIATHNVKDILYWNLRIYSYYQPWLQYQDYL